MEFWNRIIKIMGSIKAIKTQRELLTKDLKPCFSYIKKKIMKAIRLIFYLQLKSEKIFWTFQVRIRINFAVQKNRTM